MEILQFYEFKTIPENQLEFFKEWFYKKCIQYNLKGLILLAKEGINLSVSGDLFFLKQFLNECYQEPFLLGKKTRIRIQPIDSIAYKKLIIKIKPQIIPFPVEVDHSLNQNRFISPEEFQKLMEEEKAIPVDTRNYYEWKIGSFKNSIQFPIRTFRDLPNHIEWFKEQYKKNVDKIFVTFCTGGIRCEKVVPFLVEKGYEVYQIEGGILNYFFTFGNSKHFWEGECFVFDERYSILPNFKKGTIQQCELCGQPVLNYRCVRCGNFSIA